MNTFATASMSGRARSGRQRTLRRAADSSRRTGRCRPAAAKLCACTKQLDQSMSSWQTALIGLPGWKPCSLLRCPSFDFMLTHHYRELDEMADELTERWGASVPNVDAEKESGLAPRDVGSIWSETVISSVLRSLPVGACRWKLPGSVKRAARVAQERHEQQGRGVHGYRSERTVSSTCAIAVADAGIAARGRSAGFVAQRLLHRFVEGHHPPAWQRGMTDSVQLPQAVLSRRLVDAVRGRRVRSCRVHHVQLRSRVFLSCGCCRCSSRRASAKRTK